MPRFLTDLNPAEAAPKTINYSSVDTSDETGHTHAITGLAVSMAKCNSDGTLTYVGGVTTGLGAIVSASRSATGNFIFNVNGPAGGISTWIAIPSAFGSGLTANVIAYGNIGGGMATAISVNVRNTSGSAVNPDQLSLVLYPTSAV